MFLSQSILFDTFHVPKPLASFLYSFTLLSFLCAVPISCTRWHALTGDWRSNLVVANSVSLSTCGRVKTVFICSPRTESGDPHFSPLLENNTKVRTFNMPSTLLFDSLRSLPYLTFIPLYNSFASDTEPINYGNQTWCIIIVYTITMWLYLCTYYSYRNCIVFSLRSVNLP